MIMAPGKNFYKNLLDNLSDAVFFINQNKKITYWNKEAEQLTGYNDWQVNNKRCKDLFMSVNEQIIDLCTGGLCPAKKSMEQGHTCEKQIYIRHKDGHMIPVITRLKPVKDLQGNVIGAVGTLIDNSPLIKIQKEIEELQQLSFLDPLTELGNRRYAEINLQARFNEMHRYGLPFGLLFIDIDHFKRINDDYGHDIGDKVLKTAAKTILNSVRAVDTVCRWGGEEFIIINPYITKDTLYSIANRTLRLVEKSHISINSEELHITLSIGATISRTNDTIDTLLKRVDQLMYHSKVSGRNSVSIEADNKVKNDHNKHYLRQLDYSHSKSHLFSHNHNSH